MPSRSRAGLASIKVQDKDHIVFEQVLAVKSNGDVYIVETTAGTFTATNVVVATGLYQRPQIPQFKGALLDGCEVNLPRPDPEPQTGRTLVALGDDCGIHPCGPRKKFLGNDSGNVSSSEEVEELQE